MPSELGHQAGLSPHCPASSNLQDTIILYLLGFKLGALVATAAQDEEGSKS